MNSFLGEWHFDIIRLAAYHSDIDLRGDVDPSHSLLAFHAHPVVEVKFVWVYCAARLVVAVFDEVFLEFDLIIS